MQRVPMNFGNETLPKCDKIWHQVCNADPKQVSARTVVTEHKSPSAEVADTHMQDIVVLGGILGMFWPLF